VSLRDLPSLLADEPALLRVLGRREAVVAVPDAVRAFVLAGLTEVSDRRPLLVATPTTSDADRLAHDLGTYLGRDQVALFPAWETLPFERVSPSVETMGRRLRTMWLLRNRTAPTVVVAPVRALAQRLGPHVEDVEPVAVRPGARIDQAELVERLIAGGYRREYQVEHRGELAVRGSIVDVFPSTANAPVRIDLWGDEVDRLTEFSVADQRSTTDIAEALVFPSRELLPTDEVRARADKLVALEPWGRDQWDRLAQGLVFDGMESWLPWLVDDEHLLVDLLPPDGLVVLVEPRRMRDRADDIVAEEADLASTLAKTWGADRYHEPGDDDGTGHRFPPLHLPFDRLLAHTDAPVWTVINAPEGPGAPAVEARTLAPVVGDGAQLRTQLTRLQRQGFTIVVGAEGEGSAARVHRLLSEADVSARIEVAPIERGFILPSARLAVLSEADITGRRRAHRPPRVRRTDAERFFDDLKPGDHVVHHHHGVARYGGMVRRSIGNVERDYLLLEYRGDDRLYVPTDQIGAVRHYTGGEPPALSRLGGS